MSSDQLIDKLRNYLVAQKLQPGDKIEGETALADRFSVSRHHIRQALSAMVQGGILERAPRRGTVIKSFNPNLLSDYIRFQFDVAHFDISNFREARIVMERAILPLAVRRITPTQLNALEETIERMIECQDRGQEADQYDLNFHVLLVKASGNHVLEAFSGVLTTLFKSADYRRPYWDRERVVRIASEHRTILEAVRSGDPDASVAALDAHLKFHNLQRNF